MKKNSEAKQGAATNSKIETTNNGMVRQSSYQELESKTQILTDNEKAKCELNSEYYDLNNYSRTIGANFSADDSVIEKKEYNVGMIVLVTIVVLIIIVILTILIIFLQIEDFLVTLP